MELPTNSKKHVFSQDFGQWFGVKNLIRITIMAKVKYYAKEKTMVSTNRPRVLAFASDIVKRELTVSMPCRFQMVH